VPRRGPTTSRAAAGPRLLLVLGCSRARRSRTRPRRRPPAKKAPTPDPPVDLPLPPTNTSDAEPARPRRRRVRRAAPLTPQQRQEEFDLHFSRAQRAEREGRADDAMREYTAALKLVPGDPAALKGRAYLRFKRTKEGQCPRRAIEDLRLLRTYDPRGLWLEQRGALVEWMAHCDDAPTRSA
jgi:hypothetical protein